MSPDIQCCTVLWIRCVAETATNLIAAVNLPYPYAMSMDGATSRSASHHARSYCRSYRYYLHWSRRTEDCCPCALDAGRLLQQVVHGDGRGFTVQCAVRYSSAQLTQLDTTSAEPTALFQRPNGSLYPSSMVAGLPAYTALTPDGSSSLLPPAIPMEDLSAAHETEPEPHPKTASNLRHGVSRRWKSARTLVSIFVDDNAGLMLVGASQFFLSAMNVAVKVLNSLDEPVPTLELIWVRMVGSQMCYYMDIRRWCSEQPGGYVHLLNRVHLLAANPRPDIGSKGSATVACASGVHGLFRSVRDVLLFAVLVVVGCNRVVIPVANSYWPHGRHISQRTPCSQGTVCRVM